MLNFDLTPEQQALRSQAREFALREILPIAWACDEREETPPGLLEKAYKAGLMNAQVPREPPEACPYCFFPGEAFKQVEKNSTAG
jgi:acyl-CoA dehydrogenase